MMTVEPRDVAAPPDALAWIFAARGVSGHWANTTAQIKAAHRRGDRMLSTDADSQGRRWIRKLAEHTHLADHLALAKSVLHLAVAIDRVRTQLDELGLEDDVPSDEGATPLTGGASHISDARHRPTQPNDAPTDTELSQQRLNVGSSSLPDPDDVLATTTEIFERGTRQYRDADATNAGPTRTLGPPRRRR